MSYHEVVIISRQKRTLYERRKKRAHGAQISIFFQRESPLAWSQAVVFAYVVMIPLIVMQMLMAILLIKSVAVVRRAAIKISNTPDLHITNTLLGVGLVFLFYVLY